MSLAPSITALATRIGFEVRIKTDAVHPGLARVWVSSGYVGGQIVIDSAHNVTSVVRTVANRYRVHFTLTMPDTNYYWAAFARSNSNSGQQHVTTIRVSSNLRTTRYVDISCATTVTSFDDSSGIDLVVYR